MPFDAQATLATPMGERTIYRLDRVLDAAHAESLPYSIRVLLEACLRHCDDFVVTEEHVNALANYDAKSVGETEIAFKPGRVVLQDFTGVPAVVDLAAMRSGIVRMTGSRHSTTSVSCRRRPASSTRSTWSTSPRSSGRARTARSIPTPWSARIPTPP
jgi:aconitate hydratase